MDGTCVTPTYNSTATTADRLDDNTPSAFLGTDDTAKPPFETRTRLRLIGEELLEDAPQFRDVNGRNLPHDLEIHAGVVVSEYVLHAAHPTIRQMGERLARVVGQVQRRLTDR